MVHVFLLSKSRGCPLRKFGSEGQDQYKHWSVIADSSGAVLGSQSLLNRLENSWIQALLFETREVSCTERE